MGFVQSDGVIVGTPPIGGNNLVSRPFGITVYGVGDYTSYMYPGGLDLEKIFVI